MTLIAPLNTHTVRLVLALVAGGILIGLAHRLVGRLGKGRVSRFGVPITVWQSAILLRGCVLLALFAGDVLLENQTPPPWMKPDTEVEARTFFEHLSNYDGRWYLGLAEYGYVRLSKPDIEDRLGEWSTVAEGASWRWAESAAPQWKYYGPYHFFPLYPWVLQLWTSFTPGSAVAAFGLSNILFFGFLSALFALALPYGEAVAADSVRLACILPPTIFTFGAFSEPLFVCLAAWCFVELQRKRTGVAALLSGLATMTRIPAIVTCLPLVLNAWRASANRGFLVRIRRTVTVGVPAGICFAIVGAYLFAISGELFPFFKSQYLGGYGFTWPWNVVRFDLHNEYAAIILIPYWLGLWALTLLSFRFLQRDLACYCAVLLVLHSLHNHSALVRFSLETFPLVIVLAIVVQRRPSARDLVFACAGLSTMLIGARFINGYWAG